MEVTKIQSPISAFNNVLIKISKDIQNIYIDEPERKASFMDKLIFTEKSILILNKIEIKLKAFNTVFKFHGNFDENELKYVEATLANRKKLTDILHFYLFTISKISKNFDYTIQETFVKSVIDNINDYKQSMFIIPFDGKIERFYDKTLHNIFNRYSYVMKIVDVNDKTFTYKLCRVETNELSESKSIENIRFESIETIKEDELKIDKLYEFLHYIFYYGEINI